MKLELGQVKNFAVIEFIEIKKCKRGPLRIGRSRNPDCHLRRLKVLNLRRSLRGPLMSVHLEWLRLQITSACFQTTPARIAEKPERFVWQFPVRCAQSHLAQSCIKNFLRFTRVAP